jgi:hypothetical protein
MRFDISIIMRYYTAARDALGKRAYRKSSRGLMKTSWIFRHTIWVNQLNVDKYAIFRGRERTRSVRSVDHCHGHDQDHVYPPLRSSPSFPLSPLPAKFQHLPTELQLSPSKLPSPYWASSYPALASACWPPYLRMSYHDHIAQTGPFCSTNWPGNVA